MSKGFIFLFLFVWIHSQAQIVINEVCPNNADILIDSDFGNFSSWIELYNASGADVDVSGYLLSDDPSINAKWQVPGGSIIPSHGYLLIWCDAQWVGYHAGFTISAGSGSITLRTGIGSLLDKVDYPTLAFNNSYARKSDGSSEWLNSARPTPRTANSGTKSNVSLALPVVSKPSGRYSSKISISVSHAQKNVSLRFTIDGSEPSESSTPYSGSILITSTKILKVKAFHADFLPSETVSQTYLINEHSSTLPVVSISTAPEYLWDNTIGIYTDGTNGIPGNCNGNNMNWNQDWKRHAVFEYLSPTGSPLINQHLDIRIGGACSRNFPQKSFAIEARKKYGDSDLDFSFFSTKKNLKSFGSLSLRNSGNDFYSTSFRDAFLQSLHIGNMDIDYMAYQPAVFYLNGEYWGIQNLREKIDGDFIKANYGIAKDDIDLIETWEYAIEGTIDAYINYRTQLAQMSPNAPNYFSFIDQNIDVQEYINYLVTEIYVGNTDWPGNNMKFWRQRSTNGKFRWILWDTDFGFGLYGTPFDHPTLDFATEPNGPGWPNPSWSTLHIRLLMQNPEFRNRFIATLSTAMGTTFHPNRVSVLMDQYKSRIAAEVPYHKIRWGGDVASWESEIQRMRDFSTQRNAFMRIHTGNFFGLGSALKFSATSSPASAGKVNMNGVTADDFSDAPYYSSVPYNIKPVPNAGFKFTGWTVTAKNNQPITITTLGSNWKYFDFGILPSTNWNSASYNDGAWNSGNAQLGYGDGDESTVVSFGSDPNNKFVSTYFRKSFTIADTAGLQNINASALFDDGVVVYLNGTEVFRNNMPVGAISNSTLANSAIQEGVYYPFTVDHHLVKPGINIWAVEVHQIGPTSSDISFEFQASSTKQGSTETYSLSNAEVYDTVYADITMVANYETVTPIQGLVINEVSPGKSTIPDDNNEFDDWIELFNTGTSPVNISGLMLTDDFTEKSKTILKADASMIIPPGGYKILWADGQPEQGSDHLSFKLSGDGESLGLYQAIGFDTLIIEELDFGFAPQGFSLSRLPNATGSFEITNLLTPGLENQAGNSAWFFPNPVKDILNVVIGDGVSYLEIFSSIGKKVVEYKYDSEQVAPIDLSNFSAGVYIIKMTSKKGTNKERLIVFH